jgi:hypothetical protein
MHGRFPDDPSSARERVLLATHSVVQQTRKKTAQTQVPPRHDDSLAGFHGPAVMDPTGASNPRAPACARTGQGLGQAGPGENVGSATVQRSGEPGPMDKVEEPYRTPVRMRKRKVAKKRRIRRYRCLPRGRVRSLRLRPWSHRREGSCRGMESLSRRSPSEGHRETRSAVHWPWQRRCAAHPAPAEDELLRSRAHPRRCRRRRYPAEA